MILPKIDVPVYDLKLPSNGQEVKFRPFLVKEEKLLLMAVKSNDANEIIRTTKQVINNCLIESSVNIDSLPFFDIDCLFIAMRAKSVGENIEVNFVCQNDTEIGKCGGKFSINIDISNVEIDRKDNISSSIEFNSDLIFKMKYPSYSIIKLLNDDDDSLEKKIKIISASIDKIFIKGNYYSNKDMSPDEIHSFIENLTQEQFNRLSEYVSNFPTFYVKGKGKCLKCGHDHEVRYKDFVRFFQ